MTKDRLNNLYKRWMELQPLSEAQQNGLSRRFTIEYNYNSNHIEGNTLTYGQTELLLLFGTVSGEGHLQDFSEMKASQVGLEMMSQEVKDGNMPMTQTFIRQLHKTLLREDYTVYRNLPGGGQTSYVIHAGQYKTRPNSVITRYGDRFEYASPEETPSLMTDLVDWYNEAEASNKYSVVELAALFHYRYIRIHPFEDGNGRIARLMVNYILARHGWPMIVVRSRKKQDYLEALHKTDLVVGFIPSAGAHASLTKIRTFVKYFTKLVEDELAYNIAFIENKDRNMWWYDGEQLSFRTPNAPRILRFLNDDPYATYAKLSDEIGINVSAIQKLIDGMVEKGYIQRRDTDKSWHVLASSIINPS
ncbi:MAG: Fic family protein [Prevotella sp.]|nr:Fic family protein [Prevotella sp.]